MVYATQQDIENRYGVDALLVIADRNEDQVVDAAVVAAALEDASAEIDSYVGAKYPLPLATAPRVLSQLCADIAFYKLSADADAATEERRKRYKDALDLLKRFSRGEVTLGLPQPPQTTNGVAYIQSKPRHFKR
ncbi:gp436 family protein [Thiomicrorhabdus cannonii]|uniref:gp436 family protein n=1 Tax=Thiomicrorhabdus cannonii TaxID=2748011 RepID=UPI0015BAA379|nr:DUF1320 domain-containing protein [Thiomicrorhabdus cannonii]